MSPPTRRQAGRPPLSSTAEAAQRRRILTVSTRVFARRGFHDAEVQEIADRAGMGKASIYRRWPTKTALFAATIQNGATQLMTHIAACMDVPGEPIARLRAGARGYLEWWAGHPDLMELHILERAEFRGAQRKRFLLEQRDGNRRVGEVLVQLMRAGKARDLPIDRLALALGCQLYGLVYFSSLIGDRATLGDRADELIDLFLHGLLTPAGRDIFTPADWKKP